MSSPVTWETAGAACSRSFLPLGSCLKCSSRVCLFKKTLLRVWASWWVQISRNFLCWCRPLNEGTPGRPQSFGQREMAWMWVWSFDRETFLFLFVLNPPLAFRRCVSRRCNAGKLVMSHQGNFCMSASGNENASGLLPCHCLLGSLSINLSWYTIQSVSWLYLGALFVQNVMGCRIQCNTSEHLKPIGCFNRQQLVATVIIIIVDIC